jgi:NAD-dependent dihydropyrimidine dehydrogenase PreA subunit
MRLRQLLREEWEWFLAARDKAARLDQERCRGCWTCTEVCPVGCFEPDRERQVVRFLNGDVCVACGACVLQCPEGALKLERRR